MTDRSAIEPGDKPAINIKRFKIKDTWKDYFVILEVNLDRLTTDRAELINNFWTGADDRLESEDGNVIRAVVRSAGQSVIWELLEDGGAHFSFGSGYPAFTASKKLRGLEGWGGEVEGDDFGWCGIRVVAADIQLPDYEELQLTEVKR